MRYLQCMKYLVTTILLALATLSWGEEDNPFPVDLTCEVGANIFHLHLTGDKKTSWVEPKTDVSPSNQRFFDKKHLVFHQMVSINHFYQQI